MAERYFNCRRLENVRKGGSLRGLKDVDEHEVVRELGSIKARGGDSRRDIDRPSNGRGGPTGGEDLEGGVGRAELGRGLGRGGRIYARGGRLGGGFGSERHVNDHGVGRGGVGKGYHLFCPNVPPPAAPPVQPYLEILARSPPEIPVPTPNTSETPPEIPANTSEIPPEIPANTSETPPEIPVGEPSGEDQMKEASDNSRPRLNIIYNVFTPSHVASATITKCIKQKLHKDGYTWAKVPKEMKDFYWNEFQKYFTFDRDVSVVCTIWERQAARRYFGTLCEWRKLGKRPSNVTQEIWDSWQENWATAEFKSKCEKASKNRLSEVGGLGHGPSRHTGGSKSAIDHSIQLAKELGRDVSDYDIFEKIHKKANGEFVDKRSKSIADKVMSTYNAAKEDQIGDEENTDEAVDLSSIYYEFARSSKKMRVYGLGCKPSAALPATCNSTNFEPLYSEQLRSQIYEDLQEKLKKSREDLEQEMREKREDLEQEMREKQEQMKLEWNQKQKELEDLIQKTYDKWCWIFKSISK